MNYELSELEILRPDIWERGLYLATQLTCLTIVPKLPLDDGRVYACGGAWSPSAWTPPRYGEDDADPEVHSEDETEPDPLPDHNDIARKRKKERKKRRKERTSIEHEISIVDIEIDSLNKRREELVDRLDELTMSPRGNTVAVPPGAMEWLLHEVGHWVAASESERTQPNYGLSASEYGHDGEREWQAWAFEEIILAPFGPARRYAPPTQRDGAAFGKNGPMPSQHLHHIERRISDIGLDVEQWRIVWAEWVRWGCRNGEHDAPWNKLS